MWGEIVLIPLLLSSISGAHIYGRAMARIASLTEAESPVRYQFLVRCLLAATELEQQLVSEIINVTDTASEEIISFQMSVTQLLLLLSLDQTA